MEHAYSGCSYEHNRRDPAHTGKYLQFCMTLFADRNITAIKIHDQFHSLHVSYRTFLIRPVELFVDENEVLLFYTSRQQAGRPDAHESCGEDVHQEPAYELIGVQLHGLPCIGGPAVILITEPDTLVVPALDPAVGNGSTVRISGKIRDCVISALIFCCRCCFFTDGRERLDLNVPVRFIAGVQQFFPGVRVAVFLSVIVIIEAAVIMQLFKAVHELSLIDAAQGPGRKEKSIRRALFEFPCVFGQSAS